MNSWFDARWYLAIEMVVFSLGKLYCIFDGGQNSDAGGATTAPVLWCEIQSEPTMINLYLFKRRITGRNTCCCSPKLEAPFLSNSVQNMGNALF